MNFEKGFHNKDNKENESKDNFYNRKPANREIASVEGKDEKEKAQEELKEKLRKESPEDRYMHKGEAGKLMDEMREIDEGKIKEVRKKIYDTGDLRTRKDVVKEKVDKIMKKGDKKEGDQELKKLEEEIEEKVDKVLDEKNKKEIKQETKGKISKDEEERKETEDVGKKYKSEGLDKEEIKLAKEHLEKQAAVVEAREKILEKEEDEKEFSKDIEINNIQESEIEITEDELKEKREDIKKVLTEKISMKELATGKKTVEGEKKKTIKLIDDYLEKRNEFLKKENKLEKIDWSGGAQETLRIREIIFWDEVLAVNDMKNLREVIKKSMDDNYNEIRDEKNKKWKTKKLLKYLDKFEKGELDSKDLPEKYGIRKRAEELKKLEEEGEKKKKIKARRKTRIKKRKK